jgi:MarR family transcriptional regulator, organic hydroperoxide resistance regulator
VKPEDCIFFQLAKTSQRGLKYWTHTVSSLGVTAVQAMVLNFLCEEDCITSQKLGARSELDSATLTGVLDRLEAGGFIQRKSNPEDRRSILIILPDKGRDTALRIRSLVSEANSRFLGSLTPEEIGSLKFLLARLRTQDATRREARRSQATG